MQGSEDLNCDPPGEISKAEEKGRNAEYAEED